MFARRTYRVWALSAAAWCVAFGALSLYWAAGGSLGVDQLAVSLQERAAKRETGIRRPRRGDRDREGRGLDRATWARVPPAQQ
jgi:hypothetical protein